VVADHDPDAVAFSHAVFAQRIGDGVRALVDLLKVSVPESSTIAVASGKRRADAA
jgi:hypothetical protein